MKTKLVLAAMTAMIAAPAVLPSAAMAQNYNDRRYQGENRSYYEHCKKSSGTTGTVAGAVGGGLAGNLLGGGTVGTLVGAGGGALLGRHLDKKHDAAQNRKNGC